MKRKASEFERQDRSNCFTNLFPSFYNSCKIQKTTEENDFEDIDFTNVNEFKNIRTPILRKRALSDCKSMFSYPQLKRNTTKFIISQHKNCGLIHPSTCAFEARPENDEDECEISDPSESCASMVGLVTADLF